MKSIVYLVLASLYLLLYATLFEWWCDTVVGRALGSITPSAYHDIVMLVIACLGSIIAWKLPNKLSDTGNKWGRIISIGIVYILLVTSFAFNENFVHFYYVPILRYTDVLILIGICFVLSSYMMGAKNPNHKKDELQEKTYHLYYDDVNEVDFLGRTQLVDNLYDRLIKTKRNEDVAISLAITGGWGSGKSWMLEHLYDKLKAKNKLCIVFKPWLYGDADMTRSFYQTLARQLKDKSIDVSEFKKAIADIDNDELIGLGRAFLSLFGVVTKNASREKLVDNIKDKLKDLNRPIYVFVDDCDRLAKKELVQVLGLIRNTGDFPGLTYVMAFDKIVVGKIIDDETGMNYVEKMINLTIELPPVNDEVIADYLNLAAADILNKMKSEENPYNRIQITNYLSTVREAKKYLNLLQNDYKRLHHRFEKHHFNDGDFCLVELLKYKYPDIYYNLQANPNRLLSYENYSWNSPSWFPRNTVFDEDKDLLNLMIAMFHGVKDSNNPYGIIGVANKEYFPLYFDMNLKDDYVDADEFNDAVKNNEIPQKIGTWMDKGYAGIMGLLCVAHGTMNRKDVFLSMIRFIWHQCDRIPGRNTFGELTYGYDGKNVRHGFKSIMDVINKHPQIELLAYQHLTDNLCDYDDEDDVDVMIKKGELSLELMGIMLNELKSIKHTDYPYEEVRYYVEALWHKILEQVNDNKLGTSDVMDILGECTLEDTFERMVLPLVAENPKRWLGATVLQIKDKDEEYYLLKSRWTHAIFGNLTKMQNEMYEIVEAVSNEDKDYVKTYMVLINNMQYTLNHIVNVSVFKKEKYIALSDSILLGSPAAMPMKVAKTKFSQEPFWQGNDIRIHREEARYFFEGEM